MANSPFTKLEAQDRARWDGHARMLHDPTIREPRSQPTTTETAQRCRTARAYRNGEVVCGRVEIIIRADTRLGRAPRERRCVVARFLERLDPSLRADLAELVRRRGAAAWRTAERLQPIEIVFDDPRLGRRRIIGSVQPPQRRHGNLHDIEFDLHERAHHD
jgi:hypothetical protein